MHYMDIKEQIFAELTKVEEGVARLRADAVNAERQTDLEVAILTKQVRTLRDKNARANDLVEQSIGILRKLK